MKKAAPARPPWPSLQGKDVLLLDTARQGTASFWATVQEDSEIEPRIASESFISMLSEARKFRLGLVLANQYASQLDELRLSGGSVLRAILGNVGSIINFRLGVQDAELLEPVFNPTFNRFDLINLPRGNCYVNLKAGGRKPVSFSLETVYKAVHPDAGKVAELRRSSLEKYAITIEEAEKNIHQKAAKIEELAAGGLHKSHGETFFSEMLDE